MNNLKHFTITIDRRQEYRGAETIYHDLRVWLRMEAEGAGLNWISFLLIGNEASELLEGSRGHFFDGYHQLMSIGQEWLFYDIQYPSDVAGEMPVKFRRVTIPAPVQDMIAMTVAAAVSDYDAQEGRREEIRIDLSDQLADWAAHYGQGKGRIEIRSHQVGIAAEIDALRGEETFDRSWETISRLALNTTHSVYDVGIVRIYRESDHAFLWEAGRMHGGLVNHSEEGFDWSVHT